MQCRRTELVLDALEMIKPLDRAVEFRALFLSELGFHVGNLVGELGPIQFLDRGGDVCEHREALVGHFGKTAEHDDLLMRPARRHREDSRPDRGYDRGMSGKHAEIALDAGDGEPVKTSATKNGCDRKRSILRARATVTLSSSFSSSMPRMAMMSCSDLYFCSIC